MRRIDLFAFFSLVIGLTACGGGGSDGSSSSVSTNTFPPQVPLTYAGATTGATVTAPSAGTVAANVIGASTTGGSSSLLPGVSAQADAAPAQPTGATGLARRVTRALRSDTLAVAGGGGMAGVAVDNTTNCDSGTIHVSGSLADNGTGTLSVAYNACRTGLDTINGPASVSINSYDATNKIITNGVVTFTRVNFTGPGINSDFTGTLATQVDVGNATETLTQNIVTQDNSRSGHMTRTQDLVITSHFDSVTAPTFFTQSISARVVASAPGILAFTT